MKLNRIISVDYSNPQINRQRVIGATPNFGLNNNRSRIDQAVVDAFIANEAESRYAATDVYSSSVKAIPRKLSDFLNIFRANKNTETANSLKESVTKYVENPYFMGALYKY